MRKKNVLLVCLMAFLAIGWCACEADKQDLDKDSLPFFHDITVSYIPIAYDQAPDWLKPYMDEVAKGLFNSIIFRGKCKGQYVYNIHMGYDSNPIGSFYDQNGNRMDGIDREKLIYETEDWTCIAWYEFPDQSKPY